VQCNDIRIQNGQRIIAASTMTKAVSEWNKEHSNFKTLGALIHELHAKMGCLPTLAQCNDVRLQNGQRSSTPSTYAKEIKKWHRQHASSQSEHAKSMSSIGDEEIDDVDDTLVAATFTAETTEADTNGHHGVCVNRPTRKKKVSRRSGMETL
jgi:hypothetical protein